MGNKKSTDQLAAEALQTENIREALRHKQTADAEAALKAELEKRESGK